ncbi:MAG TPA: MetQ/NlpA family ABC transporter substrate-binding protein [Atopostipes sp.]|nr:MetQ/NlpA family ABC transporter substrate-binding protein [Atopostipes sp.]
MNKKLKNLLLVGAATVLAACGNGADESTENNTDVSNDTAEETPTNLVVASHLPPMTDIVEIAADVIEEPYTIELLEVTDNVQYNDAVQFKEAYASFAQHEPFMEQYNEANDGNLVALQTIYDPIVGYYSPVYNSIDEIEEGAEVAIPSDKSNETRALLTLAEQDLIELDENVAAIDVTLDDITANPLNLEFTSIDLLNLTAAYEDGVDLVFNLPTYIASIGLTPDDALFLESEENTLFALIVAVHEDNADNEATKALIDAFTSQEVYDFLTELSDVNHLYPAFESPAE